MHAGQDYRLLARHGPMALPGSLAHDLSRSPATRLGWTEVALRRLGLLNPNWPAGAGTQAPLGGCGSRGTTTRNYAVTTTATPTGSCPRLTMSLPRGARTRPASRKETIPNGIPMIVQHKSTLLMTCQHAANDVSDRNPKPCKDEPQDIADRAGGACSWPTDNGAPKRPDHVGGQSPRSYAERSSYHQERHDHSREGVTDRQPQASDAEPEVVANGLHNRQHRTRVVDAAPCGEGEIEYRRGAGRGVA